MTTEGAPTVTEKKDPKIKQIDIIIGDKVYENWGPDTVGMDEGEDVERVFGGTFQQLGVALAEGSVRARRVIVWILRRRDEPGLKYEDVKNVVGDFKLDITFETEDEVPTGPVPTGAVPDESAPSPAAAAVISPTSPTGSESDPGSGSS
jgi:hypothetical protein